MHNRNVRVTYTKGIQDSARLGGNDDQVGIVQVIRIWPYYQNAIRTKRNPSYSIHFKILEDIEIKLDHPFQIKRSDLILTNKKKITCRLADFVMQTGHKEWKWKKAESLTDLEKESWKNCGTCGCSDTNCSWNDSQGLGQKTEGIGN